jgi:hypothetical protein
VLAPTDRNTAMFNDGRPWTEADCDKLTELYEMQPRPPMEEISRRLGRGISTIQTRAWMLNLSGRRTSQSKFRACISRCGRTFLSEDVGMRMCATCREDANNYDTRYAMVCA